jgi:hypothetical protein
MTAGGGKGLNPYTHTAGESDQATVELSLMDDHLCGLAWAVAPSLNQSLCADAGGVPWMLSVVEDAQP